MILSEFNPLLIPADEIPAALAALSAWQSQLAARLLEHSANRQEPQPEDRILIIEQAAERIHETPDWLKRNARRLPFVKHISRKRWLVSETALNRWVARKG